MSKLLRGVVAGWGAQKMGCGCFGTVLTFLVLGGCSGTSASSDRRESAWLPAPDARERLRID